MLMTKTMMTTKLLIWLLLHLKLTIFESIKASWFEIVDNGECGSEPCNVTITHCRPFDVEEIVDADLKYKYALDTSFL